ncbi:DUF2007 domain-containing protein [Tenacibaculum sp. UWU-22]|uniref:putative signal transducing protein n=1 Tax=Tenacibaculum sp. UWU-22 TaxID=3234187 RepID=UPI0034DB6772
MNNFTLIFTESEILVNRLRFLLNEAGIPSIIKNHEESGRLAGFGAPNNSVELFVSNKNLKEASLITEKFKKEISE